METHSAIEAVKNWLESIGADSMVSWENARQGQRSEEAKRGNRAAVQRPVGDEQRTERQNPPNKDTSRRGNHLLRTLLRAVPLTRLFTR